ncbi:L-type lectin-domain containing receptor kinase V.9-like [Malania oleifera]|uniref:L-type lectin-domain containing receptor kinase V.9-like n=1 Tax=Malania oleifera TaxID=397392 RepID=UPI0025AE5C14|nr:L-type lectin-domain containing receptor kinase V.9-like [Malania oleifera]
MSIIMSSNTLIITAACFPLLILLLLLLNPLSLANSTDNIYGDLNGFVIDGSSIKLNHNAEVGPEGLIQLINDTSARDLCHVFYKYPFQFKNNNNSNGGSNSTTVSSFSTTFVFTIAPNDHGLDGHGLSFVISPTKDLPGIHAGRYLGVFNASNRGNASNHVVVIELDTAHDVELNDVNYDHVGIDINGIESKESAYAGYYLSNSSGDYLQKLKLASGKPIQVWVEYDGTEKELDVTMYPLDINPKPRRPLLTYRQDLSPFMRESNMYVGFSSYARLSSSTLGVSGWSFKINGKAQDLNLSRNPQPSSSHKKKKFQLRRSTKILLASTNIVLLLGLAFIFRKWISPRRNEKDFEEVLEEWEVQYGPHRFLYKDLLAATKGFTDKQVLGKGGFGQVYSGILPSSGTQVAVKKVAHNSRQGMREFVAEIATIGRLRHPNLVCLLGYCRRQQELLLVYDYVPNGSLDKFLYDNTKLSLSWSQRFKIIKDVASGLLYLHQQWVQVIIHRDIKASNVLLDGELNGKLGDFGLAKLCDRGTDPQSSVVVGTLGYIAPELARTGKASRSTDVFAFGVFMLEVVCGRKPVERRASPAELNLVDWVEGWWSRGAILEAVDERLGKLYVEEEAELVLNLGLLCTHAMAAARPCISEVLRYLDRSAGLPNNLKDIGRDENPDYSLDEVGATSNESVSIAPLTITEAFVSLGR